MTTPAVLAGFDPGPLIRRSVKGHARQVARLRRATRALLAAARAREPLDSRELGRRFAALRARLWRSPFYCHTLRPRGLSPADLSSPHDLGHFPLLDRATLRSAFASLPALPERGRVRLLVDHSSGSTAQPLTVLKEEYDTVHMWAALRFWCARLGRRLPRQPRVALLCSLPHGVEYETRLPALGDGMLVRVSLARPAAASRLAAFDPHVVFSDPAGLHWLAGQEQRPRPRLLLSSAMHLSPELRRRATRAVGAPIVNYYSTSETGPIAWECLAAAGRFHLLVPDVWVESVSGEIVVTRLRDSVLPLVRYRTGDAGAVSRGRCRCGFAGPSITALRGRRACHFVTPRGRAVDAWRLAWLFQRQPLAGFRLTQEAPGAFCLETSGDIGGGPDVVARLRRTLVSLGWECPHVECRRVSHETLAGAKPEPFVRSC